MTNPALDPIGKIPEFKYCAARVEAPSRVVASEQFEVTWRGPASRGDRIVLVEASAP